MKKMQAEINSLKENTSQVDILKEQVAFSLQMQNSRKNQRGERERSHAVSRARDRTRHIQEGGGVERDDMAATVARGGMAATVAA
ncbi:unnamed protein product [Trifolium pratense]|uniref:Uncharacterized protein n=1 Tax=Trifolium pratense TaxID=57577 RepID=A0ACB0JQP7_TRIPR|nr:unnamed protein product [Trifolium pratense]